MASHRLGARDNLAPQPIRGVCDPMTNLLIPTTRDSSVEQRTMVPYTTLWSAEHDLPYELVERPDFGIAYADETLIDRDNHGVLWRRTPSKPRHGRPEFGNVHSLRQRRAMRRLLCQVCGGPADRTGDGVLWLLPDYCGDWPGWPDGMANVEPPVCLPCVGVSIRLCPALRKGAVAVRVREFPVAGVRGVLYRSGGVSPAAIGETIVTFDDPVVQWVRAANLVRELRRCTVLPVDRLTSSQ
jgi:hypothetical protein